MWKIKIFFSTIKASSLFDSFEFIQDLSCLFVSLRSFVVSGVFLIFSVNAFLCLSCLRLYFFQLVLGNSMSLSSLYFLARCHNFVFHLFFDATDFIFFDTTRNASFWERCCCCGVFLQLFPPSTLPQSQAASMLLLLLACASALLPLPLISSLLLLSFDTDFHIPSWCTVSRAFCGKSIVAIHMTTLQSLLIFVQAICMSRGDQQFGVGRLSCEGLCMELRQECLCGVIPSSRGSSLPLLVLRVSYDPSLFFFPARHISFSIMEVTCSGSWAFPVRFVKGICPGNCDRFPDRSYRLPRSLCSVSCFLCRSICSPFVCLPHAVQNVFCFSGLFWTSYWAAVKLWIITHCFSHVCPILQMCTVLHLVVPFHSPGPGATWKTPAMTPVCLRICVNLTMILFLFSTWWSACSACVKYTLDSFFLLNTRITAIIRSLLNSVHWILRFHFSFINIPTPCLSSTFPAYIYSWPQWDSHTFVFSGLDVVDYRTASHLTPNCFLQDSLESVAAVQRPRARLYHDKVHAGPSICFSSDHLCICATAVSISILTAVR